MNKHYYFGYGMNTNKSGTASRCPAAVSVGAAALYDHDFRFAYHADVVPAIGAKTVGVLWEITDKCLESLDRLESYPVYYDRKLVPIQCDNKIYDAWVYFMQPGTPEAAPHDGYWNCLVDGYREHNVSARQLHSALRRAQDADRKYYASQTAKSFLYN